MVVWAENVAVGLDDSKIISSKEIMDRIERNQPLNYSNVVILGDIDLKKITARNLTLITIPIKIQGATINGNVDFDNVILGGTVDFKRTKFSGLASFNKTQFLKGADFEEAKFDKSAFFLGSQFNDSASFMATQFNRSVNFLEAKFRGEKAEFTRARFVGSANFASARFYVETEKFFESKFLGTAIFWDAEFNGPSDFWGAQFEDYVDFRFAKLAKSSDFTGAKFEGEVNLNGIEFESIIIEWSSLKGRTICNGPIYINLIKNFKELEQFDDADDCYYDYRDWKRTTRAWGWSKVFDYFAWLSCGYGIRWQYPVLSGILIVVLFGIYYESHALMMAMLAFPKPKRSVDLRTSELKQDLKRSISFSAIILLSLSSEWSPFGKGEYEKFINRHLYCAIFERLIGWGLLLLLIGTLTRLMVRY